MVIMERHVRSIGVNVWLVGPGYLIIEVFDGAFFFRATAGRTALTDFVPLKFHCRQLVQKQGMLCCQTSSDVSFAFKFLLTMDMFDLILKLL
jgi:hypothetical protein